MDARNKKYLGIFAVLALIVLFIVVFTNDAEATGGDEPCTEVVTIVDEEAWTEVIEHPEVTEVVHHEAVTETTPAIWANWSPNHTQGPQDYVPIWPTDERGTWHIHEQGIPGGHEGPDGVYQQGGGNSPWFYRQAEKVTVITPAYDETVVIEEAWTETIEHPEVSHEETVEVDCPDEPEVPEEPEGPTDGPPENNPPSNETPSDDPGPAPQPQTSSQSAQCLGGALVTKTTDAQGNSSTSTENGHPSCAQVDEAGEPFQEEGM